jgi:hypothetical protein
MPTLNSRWQMAWVHLVMGQLNFKEWMVVWCNTQTKSSNESNFITTLATGVYIDVRLKTVLALYLKCLPIVSVDLTNWFQIIYFLLNVLLIYLYYGISYRMIADKLHQSCSRTWLCPWSWRNIMVCILEMFTSNCQYFSADASLTWPIWRDLTWISGIIITFLCAVRLAKHTDKVKSNHISSELQCALAGICIKLGGGGGGCVDLCITFIDYCLAYLAWSILFKHPYRVGCNIFLWLNWGWWWYACHSYVGRAEALLLAAYGKGLTLPSGKFSKTTTWRVWWLPVDFSFSALMVLQIVWFA